MSMMRKCEACEQPIPQRNFVEISLRVLRSDLNESQDPIEQVYGDYCDRCVATGAAVEDLILGLKKYTGLEADKGRTTAWQKRNPPKGTRRRAASDTN